MREQAKTMECAEARDHFPAFDQETFSDKVLGHLEACAGCRAELAEYRALHAGLASLAAVDIRPPEWLLGAVTDRVAESARRRAALARARRQIETVTAPIGEHRVAAGSALGLAFVAGAVLLGRSRRHRLGGVRVA